MSKTTVHHAIKIDCTTLMVFAATEHCCQFRLISLGRAARGKRKIYSTAEAAQL